MDIFWIPSAPRSH